MSRKEIKVVNEMAANGWKYVKSMCKKINGKWRGVFVFDKNGNVAEVIVK